MSEENSQEPEVKMSFIEHLEELRKRIIRSLLAIFVGMIACWFFREDILEFMFAPLYTVWPEVDGLPALENLLNFSSLIEPFVAELKLSALGGVFLAAPFVLYQLWKFIAPGLYPKEKKLAGPFVVVSSLLFVGGSLMAYAVVFPIGFRFFLEFAAGREMNTVEAVVAIASAEDTTGHGRAPESSAPLFAGTPSERGPSSTDPAAPAQGAPDTDRDTDTQAGSDRTRPPAETPTSADTQAATDDMDTVTGEDRDTASGPPLKRDGGAPSTAARALVADIDSGDAPRDTRATSAPKVPALAKPEPPQPKSAPGGDETSWYDFLFARFSQSDCAQLKATQGAGAKTVVLTLTWDQASCGKAPPIEKVIIDEERVEAHFSPVQTPAGRLAYEGVVPAPAGPGPHRVEISYPANPHAKKLSPVLMISDYLSFAIRILLAFGLVFELPILISFLSFAGIVNYKQLLRFSRWFLVLSVVLAAMLTPPDVVTQLMLAAPLMVLYFISVGVAYFFGPKVE